MRTYHAVIVRDRQSGMLSGRVVEFPGSEAAAASLDDLDEVLRNLILSRIAIDPAHLRLESVGIL